MKRYAMKSNSMIRNRIMIDLQFKDSALPFTGRIQINSVTCCWGEHIKSTLRSLKATNERWSTDTILPLRIRRAQAQRCCAPWTSFCPQAFCGSIYGDFQVIGQYELWYTIALASIWKTNASKTVPRSFIENKSSRLSDCLCKAMNTRWE